ncbi:MAG: hypothetical protein GQ583_05945 [Methyloprofundus sp.]|nr:hypothetical protein [Methyloprofundus sp.]
MKRNKTHYISGKNTKKVPKQNIIFHEAAHATAIYFNNKTRNLPAVFFQIMINDIKSEQEENSAVSRTVDPGYAAKIKGGRLIQSFLPPDDVTDDYMAAFEADIVNLLVGPLAEAKYVHEYDDEFFNRGLVNISALNNYGGGLDLALVNEYLQSLYPGKQEQDEKFHPLFTAAIDFVEDHNYWQAIHQLANYIYASNKSIIGFEEVNSILEPLNLRN